MAKKRKVQTPRKLSPKQEKFCELYVSLGNASQAYREAYSCAKMKNETVNNNAFNLLKNSEITARVEKLKTELKEASKITKERIMEEHAKIAFSSIAHLHKNWIERTEFELLTPEQKASIKSIASRIEKRKIGDDEYADVEFVKIELYDKQRALDSLSKMLGFDAPQKVEVTGKDGAPLHSPVNYNNLSDEELLSLHRLTEKATQDNGNKSA